MAKGSTGLKKTEYIKLSHSQQRVYYLQNYYHGTTMWNILISAIFKHAIKIDVLKKAINLFIRNNHNARMHIADKKSGPFQYISEYKDAGISYIDFSGSGGEIKFSEWVEIQAKTTFEPFFDADLFQFTIIKTECGREGFFAKLHHIAFDGAAMVAVVNKIVEYYNKLEAGMETVDEKFVSYFDYVRIEEEYIKSEDFKEDRKYWNKMYSKKLPPLEMKPGVENDDCSISRVFYEFPAEISKKLYGYSDEMKCSAFKVFMSAIYAYLFRISHNEDIVVETAHHGRPPEFKNNTGMFVSNIAHRLEISPDMNFSELVEKFISSFGETVKHQRYPLDILIPYLIKKDHDIKNMFTVAIIQYYKNLYAEGVDTVSYNASESSNTLAFYISYDNKKKDRIEFFLDHKTAIFNGSEIKKMIAELIDLLTDAVTHPDKRIADLNL